MSGRILSMSVVVFGGFLLVSALTASAQGIRAGVEQLAEQLIRTAPEGGRLRVAVVDFPDLQNVTSDLGRFIANRLTTRLIQTAQFSVVERQRLGQVLTELKFSMSDLVDPAKAKQLGQMVGVEALVLGTISDLGHQVDIDAQIIEIATSQMLVGATVTISKDQVVAELLQRGRGTPETPPSGQQSPSSSPPPSQSPVQPQRPTAPDTPMLVAMSRSLKDTAAALASRAEREQPYTANVESWIREYNALLKEVKSIFQDNTYIQTLQPLEFRAYGAERQKAGTIVSAARKLERLIEAAAQGR